MKQNKIADTGLNRRAFVGAALTGACVVGLGVKTEVGLSVAQGAEPVLHDQDARKAPDWLTKGVMYQINPRAFTESGTLKEAMDKLEYLAQIGVTIVYLCPVFVADDDMDRTFWSPRQKSSGMENPRNPYRMKDYYNVDPEYGTNEDLKEYVKKAHSLGLSVMLDMVFLHCGPKAVFIETHPDFVKRDKDGKILNAAWAFPGLNFNSPELRDYLIKNMEQWVSDYQVDGFRMDVGDGIPLDFWVQARERVEKLAPQVAFLSEGSRLQDQLYAFDMNYSFPQIGTLNNVFSQKAPASQYVEICQKAEANRPKGARFMRYIDNHDIANESMNNRIENRYTFDGVNAAFVTIFTQDGTPMVYCGQDVCDKNRHSIFGNTAQARSVKPDCAPVCVDWENANSSDAKARQKLLKELSDMRRQNSALTGGETCWLANDKPESILSYVRRNDQEQILVVVNVRKEPVKTTIDCPDGFKTALAQKGQFDGKTFDLPAFGYLVLKKS